MTNFLDIRGFDCAQPDSPALIIRFSKETLDFLLHYSLKIKELKTIYLKVLRFKISIAFIYS